MRNYTWRLKAILRDALPVGSSVKDRDTSKKHQGALGPEKSRPATTFARIFPANTFVSLITKWRFLLCCFSLSGSPCSRQCTALFLAYTVKFHLVSETSISPSLHYWAFAEATLFYRIITSAVSQSQIHQIPSWVKLQSPKEIMKISIKIRNYTQHRSSFFSAKASKVCTWAFRLQRLQKPGLPLTIHHYDYGSSWVTVNHTFYLHDTSHITLYIWRFL